MSPPGGGGAGPESLVPAPRRGTCGHLPAREGSPGLFPARAELRLRSRFRGVGDRLCAEVKPRDRTWPPYLAVGLRLGTPSRGQKNSRKSRFTVILVSPKGSAATSWKSQAPGAPTLRFRQDQQHRALGTRPHQQQQVQVRVGGARHRQHLVGCLVGRSWGNNWCRFLEVSRGGRQVAWAQTLPPPTDLLCLIAPCLSVPTFGCRTKICQKHPGLRASWGLMGTAPNAGSS